MRWLPLVFALCASCLDPSAPRASSALTLRAVEPSTGDLLALGRVASLRLRFDRAVRAPGPDDVVLLRGAASDATLSDLERLPLSASAQARRLEVRVTRDEGDDELLRVEALRPASPDSELSLLVSTRLRGVDGAPLDAPHRERLRVAGIVRCGALATLDLPGEVAPAPGALPVRFDRGVRGDAPPLALLGADGAALPSTSTLGCFDPQGFARCAWITPRVALPAGDYALRLAPLLARNDVRCEAAPLRLAVRDEATPPAEFVTPLPCADDELSAAGVCARVGATEVVLRAATRRPAIVRARASPEDQSDPREAVGAPGSAHALRITGLRPLSRYALTLWALDARGAPAYLPLGAVETLVSQGDLRITEVLARPRGASAQEFVEVENAGDATVALRGWSLAAGSGASSFDTDLALPPGGRALVVGAGFDVRGSPREGDPAALPGAVVVRVRGSLASRGLRDDGAELALRDPRGVTASVFPGGDPARPPREGVSIVRAAWDLDEDDANAWSYDAEGDSTPGGPNRPR